MELSVSRAQKAHNLLSKKQLPDGSTEKPDLLGIKGDAGVKIYFLKHDIKKVFEPYFEKLDDLREDLIELMKEQQDLDKNNEEDEVRIEAIQEEAEEINNAFKEILETEEELTLSQGTFSLDKIKHYADVDQLETLDFAWEVKDCEDCPE